MRYSVRLSRMVRQTAHVYVEAESRDQARQVSSSLFARNVDLNLYGGEWIGNGTAFEDVTTVSEAPEN